MIGVLKLVPKTSHYPLEPVIIKSGSEYKLATIRSVDRIDNLIVYSYEKEELVDLKSENMFKIVLESDQVRNVLGSDWEYILDNNLIGKEVQCKTFKHISAVTIFNEED